MLQPRYRKGDRIGARYEVHQALLGGMGRVYLCLDLERNYPFALKTFQTRYLGNSRIRDHFEDEVAIWVALEKHPNIVRCFYLKTIDNHPFMFLEWIAGDKHRGTDLRGWLTSGALDWRQVLSFAIDICKGLRYAASKQPGIVHRDLKPENILIARGPVAKITDFGLATLVQSADLALADYSDGPDSRQTTVGSGHVVGTPAYMAPEQWLGRTDLDVRTDIYALGCILFEMLTGQRPFNASTLDGMCREHLETEFPKLSSDGIVPASLNAVLARCTAKQPEDRWSTVAELLQELSLLYQQQFGELPPAFEISNELTATDYYDRGLTYHSLRRYEEARRDFSQVIERDSLDAEAYSDRGSAHYHLQQFDAALDDYTQALQLDPTNSRFFLNRGSAYTALQRYEEAIADYNQALQLDPSSADGYYNRGNAYYRLNQNAEALADYTQAIHLNPLFVSVYTNRANTYASLGRLEEALGDYTRVIQLAPAHMGALFNRGLVYAALRRYDEALADFHQVLRVRPKDTQAILQIGLIEANRGDLRAALIHFEQAVKFGDVTGAQYVAQVREMLGR